MLHLFLTPSPQLVAAEVLVGFSLPMFVAALIAAFGDRFKQSVGLYRGPPAPAQTFHAQDFDPRPLRGEMALRSSSRRDLARRDARRSGAAAGRASNARPQRRAG
jgi:hypothetical protein